MRLKAKISSDRLTNIRTRITDGEIFVRTNREPTPKNGPVVVLVHGFVISSSYMVPLAHELAPLARVYAPDLPGYGRSFRPERVPGPRGLSDFLAEWMKAVGLSWANLLGNSYGCQTAAEFAVRHPGMAGKIVLVGPTVDPRHRSILGQMRRLLATSRYEDPTLGKLNRKEYRKVGLRTILATTKNCLRHHIEETLPKVKAPVLIARGSRDYVVDQRWAEEAVHLLPRGELKIVPGAGHALNYSRPLELTRIIRPFFNL